MWTPTAGMTSRGLLLSLICYYQAVCCLDVYYVPANLNQAREICDANGLVLPGPAADNMRVAQRLQQSNISATWMDLTISPAPWNWVTDGGYAIHYDQGCYNLSSLHVQRTMSNNLTDMSTCMEICAAYLYIGLQTTSQGSVNCVCTNKADIASAVSEYDCSSVCSITNDRLFCGKTMLNTFRLLSTSGLSSLTAGEELYWNVNPGLDTSSPFLCASLSIRILGGSRPNIRLVPQDCTAELPAICESDNGTVTSLHSASWFGARRLCREHGMHIVRVSSPNQINILVVNIREGWTALRGWTWRSQGLEICDLIFTNWAMGYTRKSEGDCIIALKDGSWKNVHCDTEMSFVCERSLNTSPPTECGSLIPTTSYQTDPYATTTSKPITTTSSLTNVIHNTSAVAHFTTSHGQSFDTTDDTASGLDVVGVALGTSIAILTLTTASALAILFIRRSKANRRRSWTGNPEPSYENVTPRQDNNINQPHIYEMPARVSVPEVHEYDTLAGIN